MRYEMLVMDLDGTLTNSKKEISPATKQALFDIMENGKKVVLASGRPTVGITHLAKELHLAEFGGYILSYNGGIITECKTGRIIFQKMLPDHILEDFLPLISTYPDADLITYHGDEILSLIKPNEYTELEARINQVSIRSVDDPLTYITFPIPKFLVPSASAGDIELAAKEKFHGYLNIFRSEPFFLEVMPQHIDKANSLQRLLSSLGLNADQMICCGDGYNDISMIEYAGLGVAMENAQPPVKERAGYVTKSNDEDGIAHVIREFLQD